MKYQANPVIVDAFEIYQVGPVNSDGDCCLLTRPKGEILTRQERRATSAMMARYIPAVGDYWVVQQDGYEYVNPKDVFERKYSVLPGASA